jgi:hypothetical protein
MTANEMVTLARLADHYEKHRSLSDEHDPLEVARRDLIKLKRESPRVWTYLQKSKMSDRQIGDWIYDFLVKWLKSGQSYKNFAADWSDGLS